MDDIGRIIKQQRISLSLTLQDLAASSCVSSSHLGRIERGERFFLSPQSTTEIESTGLDPYVARVLAEEPVEIQRTLIGLLAILKTITRVKS